MAEEETSSNAPAAPVDDDGGREAARSARLVRIEAAHEAAADLRDNPERARDRARVRTRIKRMGIVGDPFRMPARLPRPYGRGTFLTGHLMAAFRKRWSKP